MPVFRRKALEGIFCLMPLCLNEDQEINYDGIKANVELLEEKGIHGFIAFGAMGQMNAPSEAEFNKVCDVCVDAAKGKKIACVVSSSAINTREAIRRAKYAESAGADGSMLLLPYGFPTVHDGAMEFYQMVNDALEGEMAILLYDCPPETGYTITPADWREHLLKLENIKAVKHSNYAIHAHDALILATAEHVNAFPGSECPFWHDSMLGAKGMIGIISWVAPRAMVRYYEQCRKGNHKDPWTFNFYRTLAQVDGIVRSSAMPEPGAAYEHGRLNALAEIGGAVGGPPRKPYSRLPEKARKFLEEVVSPLVKIEKEM